MDFQKLADSFFAPTCIISVERKEDGWGEVRLVAGNEKYIEPIENPLFANAPDLPGVPDVLKIKNRFVPNSLYEDYLPKDTGFEDAYYRAAVKKIPIHTYVHLTDLELWFAIYCLPVDFEDGDICYCAYTAQPSDPGTIGVSSSQSGASSEDVIKTCIKLHSTQDFKSTMADIIHDIRHICKADGCTIILADTEKKTYDILASSFDKSSRIKQITQFNDFGDITASWLGMFGSQDCLIIKDERDLELIREINLPWYKTLIEAGVSSLVLFPLKYDHDVLGFIWATNFDTTNTMRIKETLELTTFFISSKLSAYRMLEHLKKISYTDQLTEIPNRIACTERVSRLIKSGERFTVVSVDINNFKGINASLGFDTGNKVLIAIAERLKKSAAGHDGFIARMNGDEFAIVIHGCQTDAETLGIIREYDTAIAQPLTVDSCDIFITASFGYCVFPDDAKTSDDLFSYANASMSEIKRIKSSDHILRFTRDLLREERTLEIERKLITALENDTITYALQPQFDLSHGLRGFEALARMKDSDGNAVSPGEFIPVAEKVGLVDKVDGAVFRKSAIFVGGLIKETNADITLSVNVSVRHLMKNGFIDEVRNVLETSGLPADRLEIEITESIMIESAEKALECIENIKKMGIKVAIDDFGTGYSSLSYLSNFPADLIKIDKSFIDKMNQSDSSKQYVAAIISIGHIMGFDVISEGVEENEQLTTLGDIGCDFIQGFIWGKPMSCEDAKKLVLGKEE